MHNIGRLALVSLIAWVGAAAAAESPPVPEGSGVGQRLPAFRAALLDSSGNAAVSKEVDSHGRERPTAYVVLGTRCPASRAYAERLVALEKAYGGKADIVYVYANREDTLETKLAYHKEKGLRAPLIDDRGGKVAQLLGAQKTSEVVLTDRSGTIVYRGAIDDSRDAAAVKQRYLETALAETLAGKPVTVTTSLVRA